jgi:hypothetical protein
LSKTQPHVSSGGKYNLREDHDLQAKFTSSGRKVEALELKKEWSIKIYSRNCVKFVKLMNIQLMIIQLCHVLRIAPMNKPML